MEGDGPLVVREKFHNATPMSIDRALHEMELVGHDFFLFRDEATRLPSVVYRRRGYDYGVIRLVEEVPRQPSRSPVGAQPAGRGESSHPVGDIRSPGRARPHGHRRPRFARLPPLRQSLTTVRGGWHPRRQCTQGQ